MGLRKISEPIKRLWGSKHLDEIVTTGVWHQPLSRNADTNLGYPVAEAGLLEVHNPADATMVYQRYTRYNSGDIYHRGAYNGRWAAWRRVQLD